MQVFQRTIETYESSQMYEGPALACAQIMHLGDGGSQDEVCAALSIENFPTTQAPAAICCLFRKRAPCPALFGPHVDLTEAGFASEDWI